MEMEEMVVVELCEQTVSKDKEEETKDPNDSDPDPNPIEP
jgi:hypothetical protein